MKTLGLSVVTALSLVALYPGPAGAAAKKKAAGGGVAGAPMASAEEVDKLKGNFKWGMSPEEVLNKIVEKVQASYEERLKKTVNDPTKQDRVRKEMMAQEADVRKNSLVRFDGHKSGYDVSIIDQEFGQNVNESMLVSKEDTATRYFFFASDRLYKMFVAFDKDMLAGKAFPEFGQMMQAKFGHAREVMVEEKTKGVAKKKLDHYVWNTRTGDGLRLVDRSGFYDVYCLVVFDGGVESRQADARKANAKGDRKDSLVEAVTGQGKVERDSNDNVIDQIAGKTVYKPGNEPQPANIKVPSPTQNVRAPTPSEVNRGDDSAGSEDKPAKKTKESGKEGKPKLEL
jgi:hypothetical protein